MDSISLEAVHGTKITVSQSDLVGGLALERARRVGEPFDRYLLAIDQERVRGWYVRHGFFRVQVQADIEQRGPDAVHVIFHIDEGHQAHLARVEIAGLPDDPDVDRAAIRKLIKLDDGATFDYDAFDLAKPALADALGRWGYAKAELDASVAADQVTDEAIIRLEYTSGPRCTIGAITLTGIDGDLAAAARSRLALKEGERYATVDLVDSRAALYDMTRFSMVRIDPDLGGDGTVVPIKITLTLSSRHELRLGGGVGMDPTSYQVRTRAGYSIAGFPTALETMHFELKPAIVRLRDTGMWQPRVQALTSLERMDLFRPFLTGTAEVGLQYVTVEAYTSEGPYVQLGLKSPIYGRYLQASVAWHLEELWFRLISPAVSPSFASDLGLLGAQRLGYFEQTLVADLRDNQIEPRFGAYAELRVHEGTAAAGGASSYIRAVPEVRGYVPVGPVVLATRARLGAIFGVIPVTERFFGGGANSMRGFGERQMSPYVDTVILGQLVHVPYGGGALLELSEEARFPIGTLLGLKLGGVTFLDGGDDTERLSDIDPSNLHWAAGAGLRVHTLIGAVRLDLAWRLNRYGVADPDPGSRFAFHLSIGEAF